MRNNKIVFYIFLGFLLFLSLQLNLLGEFVYQKQSTSKSWTVGHNTGGIFELRKAILPRAILSFLVPQSHFHRHSSRKLVHQSHRDIQKSTLKHYQKELPKHERNKTVISSIQSTLKKHVGRMQQQFGVQSKADDPAESRRSWGAKADDLLSQSRRSLSQSRRSWSKQTILISTKSRRSWSKRTILYVLWYESSRSRVKADDPFFIDCYVSKQTILTYAFWYESRRS